jgi:hypothetical protein
MASSGLPVLAPEPGLPLRAYRLRFNLPVPGDVALPLRVTFQARAPPIA